MPDGHPPGEQQAAGEQPGEDQLRQQRLDKLERLKRSGVDPWPARFERSHTAAEARAAFREDAPVDASLAGRMIGFRDLGKLSFAPLQDGSGQIQISFQLDVLGERYERLKDLDVGDFIGVSGELWRTKRGEITLRVRDYRLLAKSLRPLPEKWHGLADREKRYRQRYLDLIANDEARGTARTRSAVVAAMRQLLNARGFLEVETPVLQPLYGGAA
ncbi:MAG: OB-fold nucleic acid binding domain-containing protein, partial [Chloroflexota bacterium]